MFYGFNDLDYILPYREVNKDISDERQYFFEHFLVLCKVIQCVNAYVPSEYEYDSCCKAYSVTSRTVKHDIWGIQMSDYDDIMNSHPVGSDKYNSYLNGKDRGCNEGMFLSLKPKCFLLSREEYDSKVIRCPLSCLRHFEYLGFIPNMTFEKCKSDPSKTLFRVIERCGRHVTQERLVRELDWNTRPYSIPYLQQLVIDWQIPGTNDFESNVLSRSEYVLDIVEMILKVIREEDHVN
jgi:hypothetical protein